MAFYIWDTGLAQCNNSLPWFSLFKSQNHPANLSPWPGCKAESQNKKQFPFVLPVSCVRSFPAHVIYKAHAL
jgi:hypothetical protein